VERRNSPRAKCRFGCELARSRQRGSGTVVDISESGLSVNTPFEVEQGEPLLVRIDVPRQGDLELETIVWTVRRGRRRDNGQPFSLLGLMVSKAPDAYFKLLPDAAPETAPVPERTPEPETAPESQKTSEPERMPEPEPQPVPDLEADPPGLRPFRIRVQARSGPRTRVLSVNAESESEARALAMSELGDEWHVLEVQSA
jgi:hypothetical protein